MLDPGFTTEEMAALFTPAHRVEAMLRFEAALALALADTGLVPTRDAEAVAEACRDLGDRPRSVAGLHLERGDANDTPSRGDPRPTAEEQAKWVHHGTTTQDVIDTATMLQAREALDLLDSGLVSVASLMAGPGHASTVISLRSGRTFLQHARPTTFGMTVAGWLEPTLRHLAELEAG